MNGQYIFFGILIIAFLTMPIFLILEWNKNREASIKEILINFWNRRQIYIGIVFGIIITEFFIPFNKNHGFEHNADREKLGIPIIESNWKKDYQRSDKYTTYWWKPERRTGHFKKVIEYDVLSAKSESDYYSNENIENTFMWSTYNYWDKSFKYFVKKPNDNMVTFSKSGEIKISEPTIVEEINRSEFEVLISKE